MVMGVVPQRGRCCARGRHAFPEGDLEAPSADIFFAALQEKKCFIWGPLGCSYGTPQGGGSAEGRPALLRRVLDSPRRAPFWLRSKKKNVSYPGGPHGERGKPPPCGPA
jgi:hypothetical protein